MTRAATVFTDPPQAGTAWWAFPLRVAWPLLAAIAAAAVTQFIIAPHLGAYAQNLVVNVGIAIILAVSLNVVNGFTGQFSIGHAGFMSLGGYCAAAILYYGSYRLFGDNSTHGGILSWTSEGPPQGKLIQSGDWLFVGACVAGGLVAAVAGWVVGLPSLRLRGDYLAIVTLGFGEIVRVIIQGTSDQLDPTSTDPAMADLSFGRQLTHLGGALGFGQAPAYTTCFWAILFATITLIATVRLKYSGYGRALLSIRENEIAAQAVGVNLTKLKVRAFVFSAFFAGLGGGLYAMVAGTINAGDFGFQKSFDYVIMVVLGGLGSISGAAIAAVLLTLLPELLRDPPSLWPRGLIGAAVVAVLITAMARRRRGPLLTLAGGCVAWQVVFLLARRQHVNLADYRMVIYALSLIVIMIVRPQGLFGIGELWDFLPRPLRWWDRTSPGETP